MTKDDLIKKIGGETVQVIENNHVNFEYDYEKFISFLDSFLPILSSKSSSIEEVCQVFSPNIIEPLIPDVVDEEGNPLEDILTIPKTGEPLIYTIKEKGWITPALEIEYLDSYYFKSLLKKKLNLESAVLQEVAQNSLHILGRCNEPNNWGESKQGMVMGMVQSGKTVSMLNLMGLGMASGYNLFILLAGSKESLRQQSQDRIRDAFDLHNSGYLEDVSKKITIYSPTDSVGYIDIRGSAAQILKPNNPSKGYPPIIIITILKEIYNLKKLNDDIKDVEEFCKYEHIEFNTRYKALIIDDESDYASLNVSKDEIKGINRQLIKLREVIPMNCYVGYTATPQGCLAADPTSKVGYPKDFLWLLEPMKLPADVRSTLSYMGLHEFFLQYESFLVKRIARDTWPHHVKSLKGKNEGVYDPLSGRALLKTNLNKLENEFADAIKSGRKRIPQEFIDGMIELIIGCGIRWYRFNKETSTKKSLPSIEEIRNNFPYHAMMYNLSLTQNNHEKTRQVLNKCWNKVLNEFSNWLNETPSRFEYLWDEQVKKTKALKPTENIEDVDEIQKFMALAIKITQEPIHGQQDQNFIYKLNSSNEGDALNYHDTDKRKRTKKCAIFLGGNILSRGLTIDNLSVSVFVRTQATSLGDTNLQMCRWFGHKKKDVDILSLYINDSVRGLFKDITRCDDAIRASIKASIVENKRPDRVLIELWSSNLFNVTSNLKARLLHSQSNSAISYSGKNVDLREPFCSGNINDLKRNIKSLEYYLNEIRYKRNISKHLNRGDLYQEVDPDQFIDFLKELRIQKEALYVSPSSYANFLIDWDKGFNQGLLNHPLPSINIGIMTTGGEVTKRQRTFRGIPKTKNEAIELKNAAIGHFLGGPQKKAKNVYKGDRFFDKDQAWHTKNIDAVVNGRSVNEPILVLIYLIDPNYLAKIDGVGEVSLDRKNSKEGGIDLDEIMTFAAITPIGGPSYKVHTHKMINILP